MGAVDQVIALAYLRKRLVEQREVWQARLDDARCHTDRWATRCQALGAREAFRQAILLVDEAVEAIDRRQEVTKHNGS